MGPGGDAAGDQGERGQVVAVGHLEGQLQHPLVVAPAQQRRGEGEQGLDRPMGVDGGEAPRVEDLGCVLRGTRMGGQPAEGVDVIGSHGGEKRALGPGADRRRTRRGGDLPRIGRAGVGEHPDPPGRGGDLGRGLAGRAEEEPHVAREIHPAPSVHLSRSTACPGVGRDPVPIGG